MNRKLIWRIYPSFIIVILISLVAVTGYTSNSIRTFFLDQTKKELITQARILEHKITPYLFPLNREMLQKVCNEIGLVVSTRITVVLPDGTVVADSDENPAYMDNHRNRLEIDAALAGNTGSSLRFSGTLSQNMMYVAIPVKRDNDIAVVLRTSVPVTSVEQELDLLQRDRILWGITTALIASLIALILTRRISRPIEEIKKGAEHFARGDLNYHLPLPDTLELAVLADSMNHMAAELDSRIRTIVSQRNEYEAVLASMIEGVIAVDTGEKILSINQAAMNMLRIETVGLKNRSLLEMVRNAELQKMVNHTLQTGQPQEKDIALHQGGELILNLKCRPLQNAAEENIGALVVLNDVTRLRLLEDMRKDLVANVSHELKTPLTTIKGFVETLLNGSMTDDPDKSGRFLEIINKHVDRLTAIIEDLLSLARIERLNEQEKISYEQHAIHEVVRNALQLIRSKAEKKGITLSVTCDTGLKAAIDVTLLEQALVNLLDNAVIYSGEKSEVRIEAGMDKTEIQIRVIDNGPGIQKKDLPRLFERFYRAEKARSRDLGGTGLGLSIVKHIIQLHGGRVTVDTVLGKGSTFTLYLPVTDLPEPTRTGA
ncbi:HAMP domain-containing protein [bacterium]|nr:HAMP domain-containing protein [bacterium]